MKVKYKFYKWDAFENANIDYKVKVEEPYHYLSLIFEGNEKNEYLTSIIQGVEGVIQGEIEKGYSIENQSGFIGHAFEPDETEEDYPEGGFQVFDSFTLDENGDTKELFIIPLEDILKLLKEFKEFLIENGR